MKNLSLLFLLLNVVNVWSQGFIQTKLTNKNVSVFCVGDFNNDNAPDIFGLKILFGNPSQGLLFLNKNDGTISFTESPLVAGNGSYSEPDTTDLDKDGDIDILIALENGELVLLKNDGTGNFVKQNLNINGAYKFRTMDIDKDGDIDIMGISETSGKLYLYKNNGNLTFSTQELISDTKLEAFDTGDIDGDKDIDFIVGYDLFSGDQVVIYLNTGNGTFQQKVIEIDNFDNLNVVLIRDMNNDSKPELLSAGYEGLVGWKNKGGNVFEKFTISTEIEGAFGIGAMSTADYDGDHVLDISTGGSSKKPRWYKNTSLANLTYSKLDLGTIIPAYQFSNADFDQDGDIDVVSSNGDLFTFENTISQVLASSDLYNAKVSIAPNPCRDGIFIKSFDSMKNQDYEIVNSVGVTMLRGKLSTDYLSLQQLDKGIYFLKIGETNKSGASITKIIKQ